jgi:kumamolisin
MTASLLTFFLVTGNTTFAQTVTRQGTVEIPSSNTARSGPVTHGRTHLRKFHPSAVSVDNSKSLTGYETPASLACLYGLAQSVAGCNPDSLTTYALAGSRAIAVVDAYDYSAAASDLSVYSQQFNLPAANFQVVYAAGSKPKADSTGGWETEAALDVQMAHALAPYAKIYLVETASDSLPDLMHGVSVATALVQQAGGGQVSMSWGASESGSERTQYASYFKTPGITYFASAGDDPGPEFPADISSVVAAGGLTVNRDANDNFVSQTTWVSAGGGNSTVVPRPGFQQNQIPTVGIWRGMPDWSFDANPSSGVWSYDSIPEGGSSGWSIMGGTSVASPALAAIANASGHFYGQNEHVEAYDNPGSFVDVRTGNCRNGSAGSQITASPGWDFCTGLGYPFGTTGK